LVDRRIYYGSWKSAADMNADLRGAREHYEHADSPQHFAYPLSDRSPAHVVFASSPSVHAANRPVIFLVRGGMFALQYRADRWSPILKFSEDIQRRRLRFTCDETAAGFARFQRELLRIECDYSQFIESNCPICGAYVAGEPGACADCAGSQQRETETYHAATLTRWRADRAQKAEAKTARKMARLR
jgi:hypothetical protein